MATDQNKLRKAVASLRDDIGLHIRTCCKIQTKTGKLLPLRLNRAQQYIHERIEAQRAQHGKVRAIILKGRQQGASTYIGARFYCRTSINRGCNAFIVAHEQKATNNLFRMVKRYHAHNPLKPSTGNSNAIELIFDGLDGGYKLATAGSDDVGRSNTAQLLHASEFAFWQNAQMHMAGLGNTISNLPGTEIIIESTGNGCGGAFYDLWQSAEAGIGEYIAIFVPWFWQDEYRDAVPKDFELSAEDLKYQSAYGLDLGQMAFRANKIALYGKGFEWLFDQEYPATPALAFKSTTNDPLISPTTVMAAVNSSFKEKGGAFVIGCDPAEMGSDQTAIVRRYGRVVWSVDYLGQKEPMEVAGILAAMYLNEHPDAIFVDSIGIGSGIVSRLRELNIPVIAVNSARRATNDKEYENKRAEMWHLAKAWLEDTPNRLIKHPALIADLSAPGYKTSSNGRKLVEPKDAIRKRLGRSTDGGDAFVMTFAEPVAPRSAHRDSPRQHQQPASPAGY